MTTKPLFDTPQAYYDELVRRSRDGLFPSVRTPPGLNKAVACAYRSSDGCRMCAIGVLVPPDFPLTEEMEGSGGDAVSEYFQSEPWWPDWLSVGRAAAVQAAHDDTELALQRADERPAPWAHAAFMERLNTCAVFEDCNRVAA